MPTPKESLAAVKNWIPDEIAWLGFILTAIVGGVVGFIKSYEQAAVELTRRMIVWGILRRSIMAAFAGFLVYQICLIYAIGPAWGHVMSGIVGMFAAEFFEVLWVIVRARLHAITGTKSDK